MEDATEPAAEPGAQAVAALERGAYLLERALAPTAKVAAFRRAADVVAAVPPTELRRLVEAGRVTDLPAVDGPTAGRSVTRPASTRRRSSVGGTAATTSAARRNAATFAVGASARSRR